MTNFQKKKKFYVSYTVYCIIFHPVTDLLTPTPIIPERDTRTENALFSDHPESIRASPPNFSQP